MVSTTSGRERRKTAGRRMNLLVGKAQEDDDAFWGHETWKEDGEDSGNDSFRESDEDSALAKDEFDSDFDDSETDNEDEEAAAGKAEELELQKTERAAKQQRKGGSYVDRTTSSAKGKKGSGRRIMGEGFNSGIVLRFPQQMSDSWEMQRRQQQPAIAPATSSNAGAATLTAESNLTPALFPPLSSSIDISVPVVEPPTAIASSQLKKKVARNDPVIPKSTTVSTRERRSTHGVRKLRDTRSTPSQKESSVATRKGIPQQSTKSAKRKRYRQEELLMEAIHETEPENKRWLYARKRVQDQTEKDANTNVLRDRQRGKIIQKFHSRRGCLTTLTFPEMDSVPEILTRQPQNHHQSSMESAFSSEIPMGESSAEAQSDLVQSLQQKSLSVRCVITGKPARYRDPLTKQPYYDVTAFKELRQRHEAGIPIQKVAKKAEPVTAIGGTIVTDMKEGKPDTDDTAAVKPQPPPKKTKATKKAAASNSKLPFQSPKPPIAASNGPIAAETVSKDLKTTQSLSHLAFSWGNGKSNTDSSASPTSPSGRRLSRRKWKPSEKILETIVMSPKKDGVVSTPPGLRMKPEQLSVDLPALPPPPLSSIPAQALPPNNNNSQTVAGLSTSTAAAQTNSKSANKPLDKLPIKIHGTITKKRFHDPKFSGAEKVLSLSEISDAANNLYSTDAPAGEEADTNASSTGGDGQAPSENGSSRPASVP